MRIEDMATWTVDQLKNCESHSRYFSDELDALFSWMGNKCL